MKAAILAVLLSGCAGTHVEMAMGPGQGQGWEGSGPVVDLAVRKEWNTWFCELRHTSNLGSGPPFNDRYETWVERASCGVRLQPQN